MKKYTKRKDISKTNSNIWDTNDNRMWRVFNKTRAKIGLFKYLKLLIFKNCTI